MKAQIYVNRHIIRANKKATKETGVTVDAPAITIDTYLGSIYAKEVEFTDNYKLIQDAAKAKCSGTTIWLESEFASLIIDGVKANRSMFDKSIRKSTITYSNVEEVYNGWIAYDTLLKHTKKFRNSSSLNPSLNTLGDHLLAWYEDFGRQYLLAH